MDRTPVSSRSLAEIGYDAEAEALEVLFRNGGLYRYYRVPEFVYERLMQAPSRGRFLNLEIKGRYPEAKIEPARK